MAIADALSLFADNELSDPPRNMVDLSHIRSSRTNALADLSALSVFIRRQPSMFDSIPFDRTRFASNFRDAFQTHARTRLSMFRVREIRSSIRA